LDSGAGDALPAAGIFANGGFEEPGVGCGPAWTRTRGTGTLDPVAHSGSKSCRMCTTGDSALIVQLNRTVTQAGRAFRATVWRRSAPSVATKDTNLAVLLWHADGGLAGTFDSAFTTTPSDWAELRREDNVKLEPGMTVDVHISSYVATPTGEHCFLIDDFGFEIVP
jgi:hypothetical protein